MVPYPWQGPPSEGCKGKDYICQEKEGNDSGKETTHVRDEINSGERGSYNSARTVKDIHEATDLLGCKDTYDGDSPRNVEPKGAPSLKNAEPKGAMSLRNKTLLHMHKGPLGQVLVSDLA